MFDQIPLWGTKNPLKFASLPTCGFVAQLVVQVCSAQPVPGRHGFKPRRSLNFFQASISAISLTAFCCAEVATSCDFFVILFSARLFDKPSKAVHLLKSVTATQSHRVL